MRNTLSGSIRDADNKLIYLLIFLLTQIILAIFIGRAYFSPTEFVYTTHGDGAIIYYDMIFHILHGNGVMLENMNYPRFESILMTDAQASVSIVLSWFSELLKPETIIACVHIFHYFMFGVAVVYMFKIFEVLNVKRWLAFACALLVIFLSPLTFRLQAGHYGLFYPFVFVYTLYHIVCVYVSQGINVTRVFKVFIMLVFFGLNNFYIIGINAAFLLLTAITSLFNAKLKNRSWMLAAPAIMGLLAAFLCIHFSDIGSDRIEIQWGYQDNATSLLGVFLPPTSLLYDIVALFQDVSISYGESWMNLGFVSLIVLLFSPFLFRSMTPFSSKVPYLLKSFLAASFVLLIYSSAFLYSVEFLRDNVFHELRLASMFKASGRFSIPVYFMISTFVVLLLYKILERKHGLTITVFLLLVWALETNMFLRHHALGRYHSNPWTEKALKSYLNNLPDANEYQALYTLPVMEKWNDKFILNSNFAADYEARMVSLATGLPMINASLSRIGLSDGERAIQMASNPLIYKEIVDVLPSAKPVLLITRKDHSNYTIGEQYLLDNSEVVFDDGYNVWRKLAVEDINDTERLAYARDQVVMARDSVYATDGSFFAVEHFDDLQSDRFFSAPGAMKVEEESVIYQVSLPDTISGGYEISLYCHVSPELFGNPTFFVRTSGELDAEIRLDRSISKDNYIDWVRVWGWIDVPKGSTELEISIVALNQPYYIDDICLKKFDSELVDGEKGFYNNFRMQKQ